MFGAWQFSPKQNSNPSGRDPNQLPSSRFVQSRGGTTAKNHQKS